jgi:hypothetical protein
LKYQVASLQQRIEEKSATVKTPSAQILKLSSIIGEADEETKAQTKQYTTIIHEQVCFTASVSAFLVDSFFFNHSEYQRWINLFVYLLVLPISISVSIREIDS